MINVRTKGASGEREFCQWIGDNLNVPIPTRNLEQVRSGGADIIGVEPFYFEVKRCEGLDLQSWWHQVGRAVKEAVNPNIVPVVAFRRNKKNWEFLISASLIGVDRGYLRTTERVFIQFASAILLDKN